MSYRGILDFLESPIAIGWDLAPETAIAYLRGKGLSPDFDVAAATAAERASAFWVANMADKDMLGDLLASLTDAAERGLPFEEWSAGIIPTLRARGWWGDNGITPHRLQTIFRTNMQSALAVGQWERIVAQAKDAPFLMYDAVDDHRTRPLHHAWDNTVLPIANPWWRTHFPPNGWNCFPPDQPVSGRFEVGLKAWYSGPMVQLATREGRSLTVTANHPVLTGNGWVAAGMLHEGDRLLTYCGEVESVALRGVDHQDRPAAAQDVFEALAANGVPRAIVASRSALDLYGDMRFSDGHIDVVGTDRVLRVGGKAGADERGEHGHLAGTDALAHAEVARGGASGSFTEPALSASAGIPCAPELTFDGGAICAGPLQPFLLGGGPQGDAMPLQESADRIPAEPGVLRQAHDAFAGAVAFDYVVAVRRFDWSGHVYDFQTDSGFIVAGGIVTSNCRCGVIQMSAAELDDLGLTVSKVPVNGTYTWTNPRTGKTATLPEGIDPGFDFNPGAERLAELQRLAGEKVKALPPDPAKAVAASIDATRRAIELSFDTSTTAGAWHTKSWTGAPEWMLRVVVREQAVTVTSTGNGAYAMAGQMVNMPAKYVPTSLTAQSTWRHEFGHILDARIGLRTPQPGRAFAQVSSSDSFTRAMKADARDLAARTFVAKADQAPKRQAMLEAYTRLQATLVDMPSADARLLYLRDRAGSLGLDLDALRAALKAHSAALFDTLAGDIRLARILEAVERGDAERFLAEAAGMEYGTPHGVGNIASERAMVWATVRESWKKGLLGEFADLIGAATRNRIASITAGFPGHTEAYYRKRAGFGQQTEVFANLATLAGAPEAVWWELARRFMPRLARAFEEIIRNAE